MRILQVVHSFVPHTFAGTEIYTYSLSKALMKNNEVSVFFRVNNAQEKEYAVTEGSCEGITTYALNHTFSQSSSFEGLYHDKAVDEAFGEVLDRFKPEVVHIQHLLFLSSGMVRQAQKRSIPVIFTLHDFWLFCQRGQLLTDALAPCLGQPLADCKDCLALFLNIGKNRLNVYTFLRRRLPAPVLQGLKDGYSYFLRRILPRSQALQKEIARRHGLMQEVISAVSLFIAPSNFIKEKCVGLGIPPDKIQVCINGIDNEGIVSCPRTLSRDIRLAYIGTLLPAKGVHVLLSAFKRIAHPGVSLSIYGSLRPYAGYELYPQQLIESSRQDARIKVKGHFNHHEINRILSDIDVLVVPSLWPENAPLVIQEAFCAKIPVIASRIGGIPEFVKDGANGLLFSPGDEADLQGKLEEVIDHPEILAQFRLQIPLPKPIAENAIEIQALYKTIVKKDNLAYAECERIAHPL